MKWLYRLGIISVIIYIVGVLLTIYYLNGWGANLISTLELDDPAKLTQINDSANQVFFAIAVETALGFFAILFLLLSRQTRTEVIYVDKHQKLTGGNNEQINSENNLEGENLAYNEHLENVRTLIQNINLETDKIIRKENLEKLLWELAKGISAVQACLYFKDSNVDSEEYSNTFSLYATYAVYQPEVQKQTYELGEGLVGQVAKDGKWIVFKDVPENYLKVVSGLGNASPNFLLLVPIILEENSQSVQGVIEMASFSDFNPKDIDFIQEMALLLAKENIIVEVL